MMSGIRAKDTKPEMQVRKMLHSAGFRYRLHDRKLPGKPDLVLKKYGVVVMVQGCFWHGHDNCPLFRLPKSRTEFWEEKISANAERDNKNSIKLLELGWRILMVWECALKGTARLDPAELSKEMSAFVSASKQPEYEIRGLPV